MTSRWPQSFAFVVQFPASADPETGPFEGRAEHVASGRTAHFHTAEELRGFVAELLAEVRLGNAAVGPDPPSQRPDADSNRRRGPE